MAAADKWADMSNYVVHFTKGGDPDDPQNQAYNQQLGILSGETILAMNPFGCAKNLVAFKDSQRAVCLSEVPAGEWTRLVNRRSRYGVAFHKDFIRSVGGARVWYLDSDTPAKEAFKAVRLKARQDKNPDGPFWKLAPFVDYVSPGFYAFEWEREWRVIGNMNFTAEDVAFIFVPDHLHANATYFLHDGNGNAGPAYNCPIVDPLWDRDKVLETLAG